MNIAIEPIVKSVLLGLGFLVILGSQACADKELADQAPATVESAAPTSERAAASASSTNAADDSSRDGAPAGGSK